ncbi:hypothetical protein GYH30_056781 [Glycine max]|nr:hypothetical protein GYH30_056781 [Glycine max]
MEDDDAAIEVRNHVSPEPEVEDSSCCCPICLGSFLQLSYLDKCFHKFCFNCILRWTKVVASKHRSPPSSVKCPLCKTENFSIIYVVDGSCFQRHYVNQDFENSFILSRAHRYRVQCYYTEQGFVDDIFNISQYWRSQKYYQPNCWLESWLRREIQALIQVEDVDIIVHHILAVVKAALWTSFDVEGYVTGFGNPDWARTHTVATSTAPTVLALLRAGATCVGKTVMDEMAYSINGENIHYGTPRNPCAPDRVPGGSSSGSAVAVGAELVDFSLGDVLKHEILGDYVKTNVPSLKHFMSKENTDQIYSIPSLAALSSAMRFLQRYEFKNNHGEWISAVKPDLGPGISERVSDALRTTGENIDTVIL